MSNRLLQLEAAGQAVWLDFVDRTFLAQGGLRKLVADDGLTGVTSNPSIFEKAMGHGDAYDPGFNACLGRADASVMATYETAAVTDIKAAAHDLRPTYDRLNGKDGYVSLEVSPYLANDTDPTIAEAKRLWAQVAEPNLMIKVPGTPEGVPAVRALVEAGLNINITLLFSIDAYKAVAEAYLAGLEARVAKGQPIDRVASVASFFVSRIDTQIDKKIDAMVEAGEPDVQTLKSLRGKVAIANAKLAYVWFQELIASDRWKALAAKGAMPQRLLWASTGVKDPAYPDTLYVDSLIGPDTVNTVPPKTLDAFRDHGAPQVTITQDVDGARRILNDAQRLGLDLDGVTSALVDDGVKLFAEAFDALLGAVADKRAAFLGERQNGMRATLPDSLQQAVDKCLKYATVEAWTTRLWRGDASLWTGGDEGQWLGWLAAGKGEQVDLQALKQLGETAKSYKDVVLLGMGGSSLGPEVLGLILGNAPGSPRLHVLDTTDPGQIGAVASQIDPKTTLFIVSSKSGSTMEPELLREYFYWLSGHEGGRFIAVTDPGSDLEKIAKADGFAAIFHGDPAIGGRYSVLSVFGMVPAAATGLDVGGFYRATAPMVLACGPDAPPAANPGVRLGAIIGEAAAAGRNKLTILSTGKLKPLGAWLEQLLAESTGKQGKGVVPVDLELVGAPAVYADDRLFVHFHLAGEQDETLHARLDALAAAGHPVVTISLARPELIGQEFFRWEIATAVAGAIIGIDPFDQPDVEEAKVATRALVAAYESTGTLDPETPIFEDDRFQVFAPDGKKPGDGRLNGILHAYLTGLSRWQYVGFLAYVERDAEDEAIIEEMRTPVRDANRVATVVGFGPRFLHSTGQAYKGGPAGGVFLIITREPTHDLSVPGHKMRFGQVQIAQARGDGDVLSKRGRRVLRVHLKRGGGDLDALKNAVVLSLKA